MSESAEHLKQTQQKPKQLSYSEVAKIFKCRPKQVSSFSRKDPFNPSNEVAGYICRAEGPMGGSLLITTVNQKKLDEYQLVYGTPKLVYPYKDFETYELAVPECTQYFWANKWNGMNVLIFKYKDANNKIFVSAKSKGSPFLADSQFGNFLTLTREVLKLRDDQPIDLTHPLLKGLDNPEIQSKTFELCGQKEPHLVKYDFDIALKPLFLTYFDGSIVPAIENPDTDIGPLKLSTEEVIKRIREFQAKDFEKNEEFRRKNNLQRKYERNHFAVEGRVLYCLDERGRLLNRTMYKVKPPDIEEVHWSNFDSTMQGRVREALEKIYEREKPLTEASLKEELDMGPKEWSRFGKDIMKYIETLKLDSLPSLEEDKRHVVVLVGVTGSGKTHFATKLKEEGWKVLTDKNFDSKFSEVLKDKTARIVIDRPHLAPGTRRAVITECKKHGVLKIECVLLKFPFPVCKERLVKSGREDQIPTLQDQFKNLKKPKNNEGFLKMYVITSEKDFEMVIEELKSSSIPEAQASNASNISQGNNEKNKT